MLALSRRVRKEIRIGTRMVKGARNRKKQHLKLFLIIIDPALNQEVHLIPLFNYHTNVHKALIIQ